MSTTIPGDAKDRALFLYHPNGQSKRIAIDSRDPSVQDRVQNEIAALRAAGWSDTRFAQVMHHRKLGAKVVTDERQMPVLEKQGWQKECFTEGPAHPAALHPHANDDHRKARLEQQADDDDFKALKKTSK